MSVVRVFVNGVGIEIERAATALDAVAAVDRPEAERVAKGERMITDSRGLSIPARSEVFAGAIFRTVRARAALSETE